MCTVEPASSEVSLLEFAGALRTELTRLVMEYQFGVDEILTKVSILEREFLHLHNYNPIEHVGSRVKSAESTLRKLLRKGFEPSVDSIRENIHDVAGVRIVCSFIADTYRVLDTLTSQDDLRVVSIRDYIAAPKPNGYKSLHAIVEVPVYLSSGAVPVKVEVQLRTIAMDFWASLEHKIYYKYDGDVPDNLVAELTEAASTAEQLDLRMEALHTRVHGAHHGESTSSVLGSVDESLLRELWERYRAR